MAYTIHINEYPDWVVSIAAKRMIEEEIKHPELYNKKQLDSLIDISTCIVVCKDGSPVGTLCYMLVDNFLNPEFKVATETIWYVLPEFHNTRAGYILLSVFENLASKEADMATTSLLPTSNISSLNKFGFVNSEQAFIKIFRR